MRHVLKFKLAAGLAVALAAMPMTAVAQDKTVLDGVFTEDQADRGQDVYKKNCQTCHGPTLRGTPGGVALVGNRFNTTWEGKTLADLYTFIHDKMPAGKPATLSPELYIDVTAFILSKQKYPAGDAELVPDTAVLGTIQIVKAP
jgi:mono/diheme cytochrome c family protein